MIRFRGGIATNDYVITSLVGVFALLVGGNRLEFVDDPEASSTMGTLGVGCLYVVDRAEDTGRHAADNSLLKSSALSADTTINVGKDGAYKSVVATDACLCEHPDDSLVASSYSDDSGACVCTSPSDVSDEASTKWHELACRFYFS